MRALKALGLLAIIAYPFFVYSGLRLLEPWALAMVLGGSLLLREMARLQTGWPSPLLVPMLLLALILILAAVLNQGRFFLFVPVLINATLLVSFARTLLVGPSMAENFARRRRAHLGVEDIAYCRRVTEVWCAFFLANSVLILWLALLAPIEVWTLYTGLIAYALVGALFAVELTYRAWRFRRYEGDITDVFLRRLFPPGPVG